MGRIIAVSGKGGVGKTTIAGLIVSCLTRMGRGPVLAVDADPNSCLDGVLGVRADRSVGSLREEARDEARAWSAAGVSKQEMLELKIAESLVEGEDFDLIAMGRPEGPGCYCYANSVLRDILARIAANYPFVVLDNEAGLENLSRRIAPEVDTLILVADPSKRGLDTLLRLHDLAREMEVRFSRLVLVVNRLKSPGIPGQAFDLAVSVRADTLTGLPEDEELAALDAAGQSLLMLSPDNPVALAISALVHRIAAGPDVDAAAPGG